MEKEITKEQEEVLKRNAMVFTAQMILQVVGHYDPPFYNQVVGRDMASAIPLINNRYGTNIGPQGKTTLRKMLFESCIGIAERIGLVQLTPRGMEELGRVTGSRAPKKETVLEGGNGEMAANKRAGAKAGNTKKAAPKKAAAKKGSKRR